MSKLNKKQKLFVDLYYKYNLDNIKAYMEAYKTDNYGLAKHGSWRLLNEKEPVIEYVKYKQKEFEKEVDIDKDWIKRKLKVYVETYDELQLLSMKTTLTEDEENRIKILKRVINGSEAARFLDMLNKMGGFYEPEKHQVENTWNISFGDDDTEDKDEE